MAAGAAVKVRMRGGTLFTDVGVTETNNAISPAQLTLEENARRLAILGKKPVLFTIVAKQANAAVAEISPPNDTLDGTTTPVLLKVVSSAAGDTDGAANDVRAVRIIGISNSSASTTGLEYTIEEIRMNGVTAVATTRYYSRVIHMYACEWGTNGSDAAGNITLTNTAGAVTYLTITAGGNDSDNCRIWVPSGSEILCTHVHATQTTKTAATRGTLHEMRTVAFDTEGADPDLASTSFTTTFESPYATEEEDEVHVSLSNNANVSFWQTQLVGAETFELHAKLIAYDS